MWCTLTHLHPTPPYLHSSSLLRTSRYFEELTSTSSPILVSSPPSLFHTQVFRFSPDFHSSSLQFIFRPLQTLLNLLPTLTIDHNVIPQHHRPSRFLPDLVLQSIHHHCKQGRSQSRSLMYTPASVLNPSLTSVPHLTTVTLSSYISWTNPTYTTPHFFSYAFFNTHK